MFPSGFQVNGSNISTRLSAYEPYDFQKFSSDSRRARQVRRRADVSNEVEDHMELVTGLSPRRERTLLTMTTSTAIAEEDVEAAVERLQRAAHPAALPPCPRTHASFVRGSAAWTAAQRQMRTQEKEELRRVASATVRMQHDHDRRRTQRQRTFARGLALQQPFEVQYTKRAISRTWQEIAEQHDACDHDLVASPRRWHPKADELGGLVQRAVTAARATSVELVYARPPSSPRRELL